MKKDILVFGGLAGIIGNIPKEIINWGLYLSGLIKYTFVHFCAGLVVSPVTYIKDPLSIMVGIIIDFTIAAAFSLTLYLVLRKTGSDYWFLKGIGFGTIVFLICYGMLSPYFSIRIESPPFVVLMYMITNWVYGVTTCWFLKKYGTFKAF